MAALHQPAGCYTLVIDVKHFVKHNVKHLECPEKGYTNAIQCRLEVDDLWLEILSLSPALWKHCLMKSVYLT